jgi:hypothetical protein
MRRAAYKIERSENAKIYARNKRFFGFTVRVRLIMQVYEFTPVWQSSNVSLPSLGT